MPPFNCNDYTYPKGMNYDQFMAALCLWREARGCTAQEQSAIFHVLLNRVWDKRWPNSLAEVVLQPRQFSSFNAGDPNATKFPTPQNPAEWRIWQQCEDIVQNSLGDDPTKGATNYESCAQGHLPGWADQSKVTVDIGPFRFYRL